MATEIYPGVTAATETEQAAVLSGGETITEGGSFTYLGTVEEAFALYPIVHYY